MKLLILGGTGPTGQHLTRQALEKGYDVTVLARDPSKLRIQHPNLSVVTGDVRDENAVNSAVHGKDAVLSALGVGKTFTSHGLIENATGNIIAAMDAANVKRLIFLSAFGVGDTIKRGSILQKIFAKLFLRDIFADKQKGEALLKKSALDWTLVYPVILSDGPFTGKYKVGNNFKLSGGPKISRANVAHFMLRELDENAYVKRIAELM